MCEYNHSEKTYFPRAQKLHSEETLLLEGDIHSEATFIQKVDLGISLSTLSNAAMSRKYFVRRIRGFLGIEGISSQ